MAQGESQATETVAAESTRGGSGAGPRLSKSQKLLYGVGGISSGLKANALGLFLIYYYTDVMGLAPVYAGFAILAGRLWDAASDVVIGQWTDRFEHPHGRRRVFLIRAALPYTLMMWAIWSAPRGLSQLQLAVYLGASYVALYTCSTLFTVPYYALGAEIAEDYDERTSVATWRTAWVNLGMLLGSLLPALTVYGKTAEDPLPFGWELHQGWSRIGLVFSLLMFIACLVPYYCTREPRHVQSAHHPPILQAIRVTLKNRPFLIVLASSAVKTLGWALVGGLLVFASQYWLHQEDHVKYFALTQILAGVVSVPLWSRLSAATSKRTAYRVCLNMLSVTFLLAYWLSPDHLAPTYALMAIGGAGVAGNALLSTALIADVCDLDELETGRRREGMYFAVWWFFTKLPSALGGAAVGFVLAFIEYVPQVEQSAYTVEGLRLFFGPGVALFFGIGALLFATYPLTRRDYLDIRRQLDDRRDALDPT